MSDAAAAGFAEALVAACSAGDAQALQQLVSQLEEPAGAGLLNFSTEGGVTLLMHAIIGAGTGGNPAGLYLETCQLLVGYEVFLEAVDESYGRTAAHWAAYYHLHEILTELVIAGCDVTSPDVTGTSVFHLAIAEGATECLAEILRFLPPGSDILALPDALSRTPLVHAIHSENWEALQLLLQADANTNQQDLTTGRTALHEACERSAVAVELLLRGGAALDMYDAAGATPVHTAASAEGGNEILAVIARMAGSEVMDVPDSQGLTPLMHAAAHGNEANIKLLLKKKVNALAQDSQEGKTAIHWAAGNPLPSAAGCIAVLTKKNRELVNCTDALARTPLHSCAISGSVEMLQALLLAGCTLTALDGESHSAVHWAAVSGNPSVLLALLEAGCPVAPSDSNGATPLHYAAQEARELPEDEVGVVEVGMARSQRVLQCVEILIQNGAVVTATDDQGMQPLHWAMQHPFNIAVATILLAQGAEPNAKDNDGLTVLHISAQQGLAENCQFILDHTGGVYGNEVDSHNQTALFHAVESGDGDTVQLLLAVGLVPDHQNDNMRTPAHIAASLGNSSALQLLHTFNADLVARSDQGATPLHEATANGHSTAVEFLAAVGCPVGDVAGGEGGGTPLHYAVSGEHLECLRVMLTYDPAAVNATVLGEQGARLTPLDYCPADNVELADLLRSCGGLLGRELTAEVVPAETDQSEPRESTEEEEAREPDVGVVKPAEPDTVSVKSLRPATPARQSLDGLEFEAQQPLDESTASHVISPQRPRPLSRQESEIKATPPQRPGLLKRALSFLKKPPPPDQQKSDSILSSAVGFYSAHATMLAALVIGTPLGAKTMEVAEKVATDTAEDLKSTAARYKGDVPDLVWLHEEVPERPLTPPPPADSPPPPTPPSPTPPPEFTIDAYERRLRKAKAQMDMSKSAGFRAVEELVKAQDTHMRLKRQFQQTHLSEDTQQRRQAFQALEEEAGQEADNMLKRLNQRIEKAESTSEEVNKSISSELAGAHQANTELSRVMREMGVCPRPTVAEWLKGKQEKRREELQAALMRWDEGKGTREAAILLQQALTSQRAMEHAAWGARKELSAQIRALSNQPIRGEMTKGGSRKLQKSCDRTARSRDFPRPPAKAKKSGSGLILGHTSKSRSKRVTPTDSSSSVQATPVGFLKIRDSAQTTPIPRKTTPTQPSEDLWHHGQSYARGKSVPLRTTTKPRPPTDRYLRATGPKNVHAERTLHFLHPRDYAAVQTNQIAVEKQLSQELGLSPRRGGQGQRSQRDKPTHIRMTSLSFEGVKTKESATGNSAAQYHTLADSLGGRGQFPQQQQPNSVGAVLPMNVLERNPNSGTEQRQRTISASS